MSPGQEKQPGQLAVAAEGIPLVVAALMVGTWASPLTAAAPGRRFRTVAAGLIGGGLGGLLVTGYSIGLGFGGMLLTLIPAVVGGLWGAHHLSRVYSELPHALQGVPAARADRMAWRGPGLGILGGSVLRLVAATAGLSVVSSFTAGSVTASVFVGFGCLALAIMLVGFLVSLGRVTWALSAVAVSVCAEIALELTGTLTQPGARLVVAAAIVTLLILPTIVKTLGRPGRALATAVWIP